MADDLTLEQSNCECQKDAREWLGVGSRCALASSGSDPAPEPHGASQVDESIGSTVQIGSAERLSMLVYEPHQQPIFSAILRTAAHRGSYFTLVLEEQAVRPIPHLGCGFVLRIGPV